MTIPLPQARPQPAQPEEEPCIFRTVRGEDGEVRVLQLPATLENLLDPRPEDQLTQSDGHVLTLVPLFDALKRYLNRLAPDLQVFSDLQLLYGRHGYRDLAPDIAVVKGLAKRRPNRKSLDVIARGARLVLVMEVVSEGTDARKKDEEVNPELFARIGVEDLVLVYPPDLGRPLKVVAQRLTRAGVYQPILPDHRGRLFLRSVGLWLRVDFEHNRLVLVHRKTGERLLTSEEEEEARRAEAEARREAERRAEAEARRAEEAERRAAETLVMILESRGLPLSDDHRRRILDCRDGDRLRRWTLAAVTVERVDDLFRQR